MHWFTAFGPCVHTYHWLRWQSAGSRQIKIHSLVLPYKKRSCHCGHLEATYNSDKYYTTFHLTLKVQETKLLPALEFPCPQFCVSKRQWFCSHLTWSCASLTTDTVTEEPFSPVCAELKAPVSTRIREQLSQTSLIQTRKYLPIIQFLLKLQPRTQPWTWMLNINLHGLRNQSD